MKKMIFFFFVILQIFKAKISSKTNSHNSFSCCELKRSSEVQPPQECHDRKRENILALQPFITSNILCSSLLIPVEALVLTFYQFTVKSVFGQQLLMATLLFHHAVSQDDDMIRLLHHTHVPGDQQHGAVDGLVQQRLIDLVRKRESVGLMRRPGERLVED